jgi:hypothetical protein
LGAAALAAAVLGLASVLAAGLLAASFTGPEGPVGNTVSNEIGEQHRQRYDSIGIAMQTCVESR